MGARLIVRKEFEHKMRFGPYRAVSQVVVEVMRRSKDNSKDPFTRTAQQGPVDRAVRLTWERLRNRRLQ